MSFATGLNTIVVATDLEGRSEAALEYARKVAGAYGARIVLAHGLDPVEYAAVNTIPSAVLKGLTEQARGALDQMAGELVRAGIHSHSEVRQGSVAQMLVDVARQYEAGLIVVGTKGREGAGPVVVGAVAEQLVRISSCPILAVAADWNAGPNRPTPGGPIMLALERNEAAAASAATAYSLAEKFGRSLLVVHAKVSAQSRSCATALEEHGVKPIAAVDVCCIEVEGEPGDAIVAAIGKHHPSILVAGVKRASQTPGPHGTAFGLLARSRVPVLCVPPEVAPEGHETESGTAMAIPSRA